MIRSVLRASSRLSTGYSRMPAAITPTTSQLFRSFASASPSSSPVSSSSSHSSSTAVAAHSAPPPPSNLRSLKRDLSRMLDEDAADLASAPDPGLLDYLKEQRYKVAQDKDGIVRMTRTVGEYTMVVAFSPEVDDSVQEDAEGEGEDAEAGAAEAKEAKDPADDDRLPAHAWEVDLTNPSASPSTVRLQLLSSKHGQLMLESIDLKPAAQTPATDADPFSLQADPQSRLMFDDLSEGAQNKTFELLEGLGIDDKLGQFVQHYAQVVRTQAYLDKLKALKGFLQ